MVVTIVLVVLKTCREHIFTMATLATAEFKELHHALVFGDGDINPVDNSRVGRISNETRVTLQVERLNHYPTINLKNYPIEVTDLYDAVS